MDIVINFAKKYKEIVLKTLDGMGGTSIFKSGIFDSNLKIIINTLTKNEIIILWFKNLSQNQSRR